MITLSELALFNQRQVEQLFAAQVFNYPVYALATCGWLEPSMLADKDIAAFWNDIREQLNLSSDDQLAATVASQSALRRGIHQDLITWMQRYPSETEPAAFAQEISRRSYIARMSLSNNQLAQAIGQGDDRKIREIITAMHQEVPLMQINLPTAGDAHKIFMELVNSGNRSLETFIPKIDTRTGGMERQTLTVLGGCTAMGKTSFAWQIARNIAESGKRVIYFSLEMGLASLWQRSACPLIGIEWRQVLRNELTMDQKARLADIGGALAESLGDRMLINDTPQTTETIWRITATARPDFIVIDHLRLLKDQDKSEVKRQGRITENLHDIAKAHNIPVLALAQLNRETSKTDTKRPTLANLRDSGEIEENADNVWFIHRPSYYDDKVSKDQATATEIIIAKFRNGPADVLINLEFDPKKEWFL